MPPKYGKSILKGGEFSANYVFGVDLAKQEAAFMSEFSKTSKTHTLVGGQVLVNVHDETPSCKELGCSIHHPTDPNPTWIQKWSLGHMWRICPCNVSHYDYDHLNFVERTQGVEYATYLRRCNEQFVKRCSCQPFDGFANDLAAALGVL